MSKKRKDPILNDDIVTLHYIDKEEKSGVLFLRRFGDVKNKFMKKEYEKAGIQITKVYLPRTNKTWYVAYKPTGGFIFKEVK